MSAIEIEKQPAREKLDSMGVCGWPIWEKEVSNFPWKYSDRETCYVLEGKVVVVPEGGSAVEIEAGDLVVFPKGMRCTWDISEPIRKHYMFG